jgi:hypothetical protein
LYAAIGRILEGNAFPPINVAMLCLNNLLKSAPSEIALELFGDFTGGRLSAKYSVTLRQRALLRILFQSVVLSRGDSCYFQNHQIWRR